MTDTIAAISSAFGEGAIAVLRVSGPRALEIAAKVFRGKTPANEQVARTVQFGSVVDEERKLDHVLLTVFRGPASYTGEDLVEISCHGGILVTRRIYEALLRCGARAAEPGEFTQRAFLHGKMDLTQAEGVMDLISAQTDLALRAANEQLEGRLGDRIRELRAALLEILAHVEAFIDFPDEDIDPDTGANLRARIDSARSDIGRLLDTAAQGRVLREGVRTVIYGAPNVGKSSLLNRLLGIERAIVSAQPGTTRDVIEEVINLWGIPLRLIDTAGVRESEDEIEKEGMQRTRQQLDRADLILHLVDGTAQPPEDTDPFGDSIRESRRLLVLNKADLPEHESWRAKEAIRISCKTGAGLDALGEAIESSILGGAAQRDWTVAINARHQACLERARGYLEAANRAFDDGLSPEFIAEELRAGLDAVGDIVGRVDTEDLLGVIFAQFCIGK